MVDFSMVFPAGFLWGTATAAHQVEGGSPPNNWTRWEEAGRVFRQQRAGLACDWWGGRYAEDFERAAELHNNAHRFSVEWSRVEPEPGRYDDAALQHYADMVSALHARGLAPLITLHHFSNPLWIEDQGGWTNPATIGHFERFVQRVVEALGGGVSTWCTINEPMVYATQGYLFGYFPPGARSFGQTIRVAENLLRAHAAAYHAIKALQPDAQVGLAKHQIALKPGFPALVHRRALNIVDNFFNRAFVHALTTGTLRFPSRTVSVPEARDTLDWIGLNYYYRFRVTFNLLAPRQLFLRQARPRDGIPGPGDTGEIWPEGLFGEIKRLFEMTGKPLYITENGVPDIDDSIRPLALIRSLRSVWQAINHNYPVRGYFFWSLVDNFEWAEGYDPRFRFGLYGCDAETQQRVKRRSADLYGEIGAANALTAEMVRRYVPGQAEALFPGVKVKSSVELPQP
ncbi:MAG: glycoside hydrolase family 1 protein [Chloroflexi bacterium]|nr:glycoside hydrolase family 1 protein [Chloroflexota bacterium]